MPSLNIAGVGRIEVDEADLDSNCMYRILLLEDDPSSSATTVETLKERMPFHIDVAASAQQADDHLRNSRYDAVIADVRLGDQTTVGASEQGDEWLLARRHRLQGTFRVALTAFPGSIQRPALLTRTGVNVVVKGPPEFELYDQIQSRALAKLADTMFNALSQSGSGMIGHSDLPPISPSSARRLAEHARALFVQWLRSRTQADRDVLWIGQRSLSMNDLADEVNKGSKLGNELTEAFLNDMSSLLDVKTGCPQVQDENSQKDSH